MKPRRCSEKGLAIIKEFESLRLKAYLCPAEIWTIGYGHTEGVQEGDTCTEEEAEAFLVSDVKWAESCVVKHVEPYVDQDKFDALVSLVFNIGCRAFEKSTLLKLINDYQFEGAARQFPKWNKSNGQVLAGLTRRRNAEMELFS